ncbi:MAG: hypothetical protein Q8M65_06535 [Rhodoglobus sp.]|nr:hypothetical protein [Rhodoglobus sp.]
MRRPVIIGSAGLLLVLTGCTVASPAAVDASELGARLEAIDSAIAQWRDATDLPSVWRAAEEVRNLVVGPDGPYYGDSDGDGTVGGANSEGVLPGLEGQPGLAQGTDSPCVESDVLGGSWADAAERWSILRTAIVEWAPSNNTFPSLPSHPQRIVGWATLALESDDLVAAVEYGGHANLHVDISMAALTECAD